MLLWRAWEFSQYTWLTHIRVVIARFMAHILIQHILISYFKEERTRWSTVILAARA